MIVDRAAVAAALPNIEIGAQLGAGAFGLVLAGHHRGLRRDVAIKVLPAGTDGRAGFAAEAQVLAGLDHPHIVRVHDYVETADLCLIVMELLPGGTLSRRRDSLPQEAACAVGLGIASALAHAHEKGVLHRDIKSDNVLFDAAGLVKVTDFGIAKILESTDVTASSQVGTPAYMAPEQITGGRIGPAADIYSLGVLLYRLLAGTAPFDPTLPLPVIWQQHLDRMPPPPPGVPTPVAGVVLRALAKDPASRQPSAQALAIDLASAAVAAYGRGWVARSGMPLRVDDDVRDAAAGTAARPAAAFGGPATPPALAAPGGPVTPPVTPNPPPWAVGPPAAMGGAIPPTPVPTPMPTPPPAQQWQPPVGAAAPGPPTQAWATQRAAAPSQPGWPNPWQPPPGAGTSPGREPGGRGPRRSVLIATVAGGCALALALTLVVVLTRGGGGPVSEHPARTTPPTTEAVRTAFTIGFQGPLSGTNKELGDNALRAVRLAVDQANASGKYPFTLSVVSADDANEAAKAPAATRTLVSNADVTAVVGPMYWRTIEASESMYSTAGLLSVSPTASETELTSRGYTTFFQAVSRDAVQGAAAADYVAKVLKPAKVFSLAVDDGYGKEVSGGFERGLSSHGVAIIHDTVADENVDFAAEVAKITASGAALVFYSGYTEGLARLAGALRAGGFAGALMGSDATFHSDFPDQATAGAAEGTYFICACADSNFYPDFTAAFKAANGGTWPGPASVEAYDVTNAIIKALAGVGGKATRDSLTAAFRNVDSTGLTKRLTFGPSGEVKGSTFFAYRYENGDWKTLGPLSALIPG